MIPLQKFFIPPPIVIPQLISSPWRFASPPASTPQPTGPHCAEDVVADSPKSQEVGSLRPKGKDP